jgi:predicted DNA-binding transcriptional regulator YafY
MKRLDRITAIHIQLQSKKLVIAREMAERFEVTNRTIYRDIQTLRQAGVPIGEEEGKGYFLVDGYRLPPVMFTPEEAKSLVAVKNILNYHTEDSLNKNFESALLKIKAVLPDSEKNKLEFLDSRTAFHEPWAPKSSHLEQIQKSITENIKLKISYHSKKEDEDTVRIICPYALYFSGAVWTTIGYCELRKEIREFRLDRINSLDELVETFIPDKGFNLNKYLQERAKKIF